MLLSSLVFVYHLVKISRIISLTLEVALLNENLLTTNFENLIIPAKKQQTLYFNFFSCCYTHKCL